MRRVAAVVVACLTGAALASPVEADLFYDDAAQEAFGFDERGVRVEGADPDGEFAEAWDRFRRTRIGAELRYRLDRRTDAQITIRIGDNDTIYADREHDHDHDHAVHGVARRIPADDGTFRYEIWIATDATGGVDNLAGTIFHEMRHVEVWINGDADAVHLPIDAGYDADLLTFKSQLDALPGRSDGGPAITSPTPIWDELEKRRRADIQTAGALEDILFDGLTLTLDPPTLDGAEITDVTLVPEIDAQLADYLNDKLSTTADDETVIDDPGDGGGRPCVPTDTGTVCPPEGAGAKQGDTVIGIRFADELPTSGDTTADFNINTFVAFDSDGIDENNVPPLDDVDNWPFVGADRWYRIYWSAEQLDFEFRSEGVVGGTLDAVESDAAGIVEANAAFFVVPSEDLSAEFPLVRPGVISYQGSLPDGPHSVDPLGALSSDPMVGIDGSLVFGSPTARVGTPNGALVYFGPTVVPSGGTLRTASCVYGLDGLPLVGQPVATTLGSPPDSPDASHASAVTDDLGCFTAPLPVDEPPGESKLWLFDGERVEEVTTIILIEPYLIASEP